MIVPDPSPPTLALPRKGGGDKKGTAAFRTDHDGNQEQAAMASNTEQTELQSAPDRIALMEAAPSEVRADQPTGARVVGLVGLIALVIGILSLVRNMAVS